MTSSLGHIDGIRKMYFITPVYGAFLFILASCMQSAKTDEKLIVDDNSLVAVRTIPKLNISEKMAKSLDAIGFLTSGCTVSHVGQGIVITAGHCFNAGRSRHSGPCAEEIAWGYRIDAKPYLKSRCTRVLAMEKNEERDYAIFEVDKIPRASVPVDFSASFKFGTMVRTLGHSNSSYLQASSYCSLEERGDFGPNFAKYGDLYFFYKCDTLPGSSGGPVFRFSDGKVIGIHMGGLRGTPKNANEVWNIGTFLTETPIAEFFGDR